MARAPAKSAPVKAGPGRSLGANELLELASPPAEQVFVLLGSDEYLRERVSERLVKGLLDPGFAEFNHQVLTCTGTTRIQAVIDALSELPMMTDRRILELRCADSLSSKLVEAATAELKRALARPGLVVLIGAEKASPLVAAAQQQGLTVLCQVEEKDRPVWARAQIKRLGLKLEPGALEALLERTGAELRALSTHLEKLHLYSGGQTVSLAEVEQLVPVSSQVQTWRLTAALGAKDLPQAMQLMGRLLGAGESPQGLLSYINSYLVSLVQTQGLMAELGNHAAVAKALGPRKTDYHVKMTLKDAATWSQAELAGIFERITRADLRIKTGDDPRLLLQLLLLQICSRRGK